MSGALGALSAPEPIAKDLIGAELKPTPGLALPATEVADSAKLKRLIHSLAVQGKLFQPLFAVTARFRELPLDWIWATVGDVCSVVTDGEHATPTRCDDASAIPLVTAKNVRDGAFDYRVTDFVPLEVATKCWSRCRPTVNDILMVSVGATLGRLAVLRDAKDMVLVRSVTLLRPKEGVIASDYLALHLRSTQTQGDIWQSVKQSAQPCLYLGKTSVLRIAVPPLHEQHRIVARVEELMKLCDALEQSGRLADEQHARLTSTLFDALPCPPASRPMRSPRTGSASPSTSIFC